MPVLTKGSRGAEVTALQNALAARGFDPGGVDGKFGNGTHDAVVAFQQSVGLPADGAVGPVTARVLGLTPPAAVVSLIPAVTIEMASKIVPGATRTNVEHNLPFVLNSLVKPQLADKFMILMALATIRAETSSFRPIDEGKSRFNSSPGGDFDLYDSRAGLGNLGPPDGARFKGRGFIQLTGRSNYEVHGKAIGLGTQLVDDPDLANEPDIAARLMASFLKRQEAGIRAALSAGDLRKARKLVNGGSHGLEVFEDSFQIGKDVLPDELAVVRSAGAAE